ncbi:MAG TPA: M36 family metallopeptidase, partial [Nocardioidaceae bacterium]
MSQHVSSARRGAIAFLAATAVAGLTVSALPNGAVASAAHRDASSARTKTSSPAATSPTNARDSKDDFDARTVSEPGAVAVAEKAVKGTAPADVAKLRKQLGASAIVDIDPLTGTPANLTALNRFLTGRSSAPAGNVVMQYVRRHARELGLRSSDLSTFRLNRSYVDPAGIRHLAWTQSVKGVTVFGNGLEAHVTKNGQLISLQGSPVSGLSQLTTGMSSAPAMSASRAREASAKDVGATVAPGGERSLGKGEATLWSNGDRATPAWFVTPGGVRLAWSTYTSSGDGLDFAHVLDASTGRVLYRHDLVDHDRGDAKVYDNYPGAAHGGTAHVVNFVKRGWIGRGASWLTGANVEAWADLNDDDLVNAGEKTPLPGTKHGAQFTLQKFHSNPLCSPRFVCTWNPNRARSWQTNKKADVANAFYLANTFHDYLAKRPIGFTAGAGNFEAADGDPVLLNALDGANTANGLPDGAHIDNANMSTPPDGQAPTMQMYLWHFPHTTNAEEPFIPVSGAFDASILFHEYTHGLSGRLVVDAQGNEALGSIQAGAMGEAWSDWYAQDYLVAKGFERDSVDKDGQILEGKYTLANQFPFRTMAMDCDPDSTAANCTDPITGDRGGYTYGDFPRIGGSPEVHSSGEVWSQTLWDIREQYGHTVAAALVTRGMQLSPNDPTMLDMRNAIIQADKVVYNSKHATGLWRIFANRGMGWYAGTTEGGDVTPAEDFHVPPPAHLGLGSIGGIVIDHVTGDPIEGARVTITGHPGYTDTTDADGSYLIGNVKPGTYKKVVVSGSGYEVVVQQVRVPGAGAAKR